ncbi:MAG: hypothetical protein EHM20_10665 [Alphaproteobacteria bacterium]|nr:MAG: hypothetical protein EHM20_10665 [Alphaproteobacteria bacterium]
MNDQGNKYMSKTQSITFHEVIEMIEMLPEEEQETVLDIVQHRLKERGRERIIENVKKAREELESGKVRQGTVKELMKEVIS